MDTIDHSQKPEKRPVFLTVLCILTIVSCSFAALEVLVNAMNGPASVDKLEANQTIMLKSASDLRAQHMDSAGDLIEKFAAIPFYINDKFYAVLAMNFLSTALGLGGAILMLRRRKLGFHSYILYNILALVTIYVAVPVKEVPALYTIVSVILSGIFIFMYSRNLKWLR